MGFSLPTPTGCVRWDWKRQPARFSHRSQPVGVGRIGFAKWGRGTPKSGSPVRVKHHATLCAMRTPCPATLRDNPAGNTAVFNCYGGASKWSGCRVGTGVTAGLHKRTVPFSSDENGDSPPVASLAPGLWSPAPTASRYSCGTARRAGRPCCTNCSRVVRPAVADRHGLLTSGWRPDFLAPDLGVGPDELLVCPGNGKAHELAAAAGFQPPPT